MIRRYKENEVEQLANILKDNGVISVPTDTVYGICARINSKKAHDKLIAVKNRPRIRNKWKRYNSSKDGNIKGFRGIN